MKTLAKEYIQKMLKETLQENAAYHQNFWKVPGQTIQKNAAVEFKQ